MVGHSREANITSAMLGVFGSHRGPRLRALQRLETTGKGEACPVGVRWFIIALILHSLLGRTIIPRCRNLLGGGDCCLWRLDG
ncbi:hypothetical protein BO85DRAFT_206360 [Aspergillus piperis CBS 112811]|uniref:Uncharacterized protein n=1 Tax=Aspergillus piperis CBS 112811 TaxID=1448313 RepID=A0A8G1VH40_9EURO|nr:hypothetical protein BO85DRAFT_206360 [Aspergillus piperis CBS 112811]RAH52235.1 hypothetical protein BO85DRAFT_206360 [Aspergillus piperis CBS 112811]